MPEVPWSKPDAVEPTVVTRIDDSGNKRQVASGASAEPSIVKSKLDSDVKASDDWKKVLGVFIVGDEIDEAEIRANSKAMFEKRRLASYVNNAALIDYISKFKEK